MSERRKRCGNCDYYRMVDSCFGECFRFPPITVPASAELRWRRWFPRVEYRYKQDRPEMAESGKVCGEFQERIHPYSK